MKPSIIYVISLGHSGSTILQYLLASQKNVLGLGEVNQIAKYHGTLDYSSKCSCDYPIKICSIWCNLINKEHASDISFYKNLTKQLCLKFPQFSHWVDTSKSIKGISPWLTLLAEGEISNVKILFLTRDVRGWVLSEQSRRYRKSLFRRPLFLLMLDWKRRQKRLIKNLQHSQISFLIVSYESLIFQTQFALSRIANFVPLSSNTNMWNTNLNHAIVHDVFGNRMKNDPVKRSTINYDDTWQYHLGINVLTPLLLPIWQFNTKLRKQSYLKN